MFGEENNCMYYVLPLVKLGKPSFGSGNLKQCYIDRDYKVIVVSKVKQDHLIKHENYFTDFTVDGEFYYVFVIPEAFRDDFNKYMKGEYSRMSDSAKDLIRRCSGLTYRKKVNGVVTTSAGLQVLGRSESLRKRLEYALDTEIDPGAELASVPGMNVYMSLSGEEE